MTMGGTENFSSLQYTNTQKKSLRWAEASENLASVPVHDLSRKELRDLMWYTPKEIKIFHRECRSIARNLILERDSTNHAKRDLTNQQDFCDRGIEYLVDKVAAAKRRKRKQTAVEAVLEEQSHQRHFGTFSADFLAELYQDVTQPCIHEAYARGLRDAQDARSAVDVMAKGKKNSRRKKSSFGMSSSSSTKPLSLPVESSCRIGCTVLPHRMTRGPMAA